MSGGRGKRSPAFKTNVALEAVKGQERVTPPAVQYEVHLGRIQAWRKALNYGAAGVFGNGQDRKAKNDVGLTAR